MNIKNMIRTVNERDASFFFIITLKVSVIIKDKQYENDMTKSSWNLIFVCFQTILED